MLGVDNSSLQNAQMFYKSTRGWVGFSALSDLSVPRDAAINVTYVIREQYRDKERSGVLVIKSGTLAPDLTERPPVDRVQLVRDRNDTDAACPSPKDFQSAYVAGKAYEDYHAYARRPLYAPDTAVIDRFHIKYRRSRGCIATNSVDGGRVNNSSQFSFQTNIVEDGIPVSIWPFTTNYSGPGPYAARRTEIRHYHLSNGLQCVSFVIQISANGHSFLRVNDLEGFEPPPSTRRQVERRLAN